jgi:hypothetical protein
VIPAYLDKNLCAHKLADLCSATGLSDVDLLPKAIRELKDPDLLQWLLQPGRLLLTNDRKIAFENAHWMPTRHGGIVIIEDDAYANRRITWKITRDLLDAFKLDFPAWSVAQWRNSVVVVHPFRIAAYHFDANGLHTDGDYDRTSAWQPALASILSTNAAR